MIPNGEGWHYLAVKKLAALLRGITAKHHGGFSGLNCFQEKKLESHKKVWASKNFCNVLMSSQDTKIFEFNEYQKCLIEKIDGYKNNPENSFMTNLGEHILLGLSVSTISSFKNIENKDGAYRALYETLIQRLYENICESLREYPMKIIKFKKKKMNLLSNEQQESYGNWKICYNCNKKLENKYLKLKNIIKLKIINIIQGNIDVLHIAYLIWNIAYLIKFL